MSEAAEKYAAITELIGEMSWGIDVPSPIVLSYVERLGEGIKTIAMTPTSMEPVFEAIYQKLKSAPEYNPLKDANKRIAEQDALIKELQEMVTECNGFNCCPLAEENKALREQVRWKNIGDLPFHEHGRILVLYHGEYINIKNADTARRDVEVTHWMPLPSPPVEVANEN